MGISTGKKARRQVPQPGRHSNRRNDSVGKETTNRRNRVAPQEDQINELPPREFEEIKTKNWAQGDYLRMLEDNDVVFGLGPAGTGKTYLATAYASELLFYKEIEKIIITRPAVEACDEKLGFLPGELEDKFRPYLIPFLDTFYEKLGKGFTEYCIKRGIIEPIPLGFMRGRSFKNTLVILDEAENTNPRQMELILTRLGDNCRILINGDERQKDIQGTSGLEDAKDAIGHLPGVGVMNFTMSDVVRSPLCKSIVKAYHDR